MFGGKKQEKAVSVGSSEVQTLIGAGCEFEGNLRLEGGMVRIDGVIKGDITGNAFVVIGKEGKVFGNIKVEHLALYGEVRGNVEAGEVELHEGSILEGDMNVKALFVEKGAIFNGKCLMERGSRSSPEEV